MAARVRRCKAAKLTGKRFGQGQQWSISLSSGMEIITTPEKAKECMEISGCDGVAIGRGVLVIQGLLQD
jgi:hypothetical protein